MEGLKREKDTVTRAIVLKLTEEVRMDGGRPVRSSCNNPGKR